MKTRETKEKQKQVQTLAELLSMAFEHAGDLGNQLLGLIEAQEEDNRATLLASALSTVGTVEPTTKWGGDRAISEEEWDTRYQRLKGFVVRVGDFASTGMNETPYFASLIWTRLQQLDDRVDRVVALEAIMTDIAPYAPVPEHICRCDADAVSVELSSPEMTEAKGMLNTFFNGKHSKIELGAMMDHLLEKAASREQRIALLLEFYHHRPRVERTMVVMSADLIPDEIRERLSKGCDCALCRARREQQQNNGDEKPATEPAGAAS